LINQFVKDYPQTVGTCHSVVHTLGINAYLKNKDIRKIYSEGSNTCSWAFLHGAIISAYKDVSEKDLSQITKNLCTSLKELDQTAEGECYHGVGHAVMLATKNFAKAMGVCEVIEDERGLTSCIQGAIMEYSATFPNDPVGGASVAEQTYKDCLSLNSPAVKSYCIYSVGESSLRSDGRAGDVKLSWKRCQVVGSEFLHDCAKGLGKAAPDQEGWNSKGAVKICNDLPDSYQQDCNLVAVTTLATVLLDAKYVPEYCSLIKAKFKDECLAVLPEINDYIKKNTNK
jgi:hypothetical protein